MSPNAVTAFLFTDIEGSTRLWEDDPQRMRVALACHDRILRDAIEAHGGSVVKTTGDGVHAAFGDPRDAIAAVVDAQRALADPSSTGGLALRVRAGIHAGVAERSDGDYFGSAVNRAARIMSAAHGEQVLVSQSVADLARARLPDGVSLRDLGAVRLRDLAGAEHLYQVEHPRLRREFPALRSLEAVPNNLPQPVTSFVGREREIAHVEDLLSRTRLLTLTGIGGLGKTRLSLHVAAAVLGNYPDGAWFVELAPIVDGELVAQAVASVLGVKEEAGRGVAESLANHARDRRMLIVLDNCEHVVTHCARLAKSLLQASGHVTILATSREHLAVAGEAVYTVPPLPLPEGDATGADSVAQSEAVRLFAERAKAVQPAFALTDRNAAAVVEICRRLDGIPLALELAAARVRALGVDEIAARVGDRFRLLTSGARTAEPRQQTLRAMIDWSHDLLSPNERTLFRRLSVFAGGWTLEGAEAVASGGGVERSEVLDLLAGLVDKSLVIAPAEGGRYALLETVRQYADERLQCSAENGAVRRRHLDFHLAFAEKAGAALAGPEQQAWLARIDDERENLLAAHAWCARCDDGAQADCRLVSAIKLYWFMRGLLDLGRRVTVDAIGLPATDPRTPARCSALWVAGQICSYSGRYAEAQRYLHEALDIAQMRADRAMVAAVRNYLALAALGQGDRAAARMHSEEALALARESGSVRHIAVAANALAQLARLDGHLDAAQRLYEEVVALAAQAQDREFAAIGTLGLAMVAIARGLPARGGELLRDAMTIAEETGSTPARHSAVEVAAGLAALCERWDLAASLHGAAQAQTVRTGIRRDPADAAFLEPLIAKTRAALGGPRFAELEAAGGAMSFDQALDRLRAWLTG